MGVIGAPHGIKGEVRLRSYTGRPADVAGYGPLHAEGRAAPLVLRAARPIKDDMLVVRFAGIDDRDAAAALTNTRLFIDRAALPAANEEEFYHADLIGLRAETATGDPLGDVVAVVNFGGGDLLEIAAAGRESLLVAFTRSFVPHVDLAGGRLIVAPEALASGGPGQDEPDPMDEPGPVAGGQGTRR